MKTAWKIMVVLVVVSLAGIGYWFYSSITGRTVQPGQYDELAQCLTEKGAVFYGAYWCHFCEKQKEMFGSSIKFINYVECDPLGKDAQPDLCRVNGIRGYPTWVIDGKQYEGVQSLERLSQLTGCSIQ